MRFTDACRVAIREEMARDERVFVMGEDCREGIMGRTRDLVSEFGVDRVRNTPISEAAVVGAAIGAAATGMVPVLELMVGNFLYVAMDQIANQAAKFRYMLGGAAGLPLTLLANTGASGGMGPQHSDSIYAQVINAGGIKVVVPSTPEDAKGLLKAAIRDPDPVLFLAPTALSGLRGEVPDDDHVVPLGEARVLRAGDGVTIVGVGAMAQRSLLAAEILAAKGISAEVLDPRTLHPLDVAAIVASVRKTGRLVCVDEARRSCSVASEIVARVCSVALGALRAPPAVVANPDVHVPFSPALEAEVVPQVADIVGAASACCRPSVA
jgi:pyruvate dehydrogenase E1 component beta subunit